MIAHAVFCAPPFPQKKSAPWTLEIGSFLFRSGCLGELVADAIQAIQGSVGSLPRQYNGGICYQERGRKGILEQSVFMAYAKSPESRDSVQLPSRRIEQSTQT